MFSNKTYWQILLIVLILFLWFWSTEQIRMLTCNKTLIRDLSIKLFFKFYFQTEQRRVSCCQRNKWLDSTSIFLYFNFVFIFIYFTLISHRFLNRDLAHHLEPPLRHSSRAWGRSSTLVWVKKFCTSVWKMRKVWRREETRWGGEYFMLLGTKTCLK